MSNQAQANIDPIELDAFDREELAGPIIVRRPNVAVLVDDANNHPEFTRGNLLYLLRLAPLTEENAHGDLVLSSAGNFFAIQDHDVNEYRNSYAAKFGFTCRECIKRFRNVVNEIKAKGFPRDDIDAVYVAAIDGIPDDRNLLHQLEHGLRNALGREGLRLAQHARGVHHPGNRTALAETFEFVVTDLQGDTIFELYRQYAEHLEATRRRVERQIRHEDRARGQRLWRRLADIWERYEAYSQILLPEALPELIERMEAVIRREERNYPLVPVHSIYSRALQHAAATFTFTHA